MQYPACSGTTATISDSISYNSGSDLIGSNQIGQDDNNDSSNFPNDDYDRSLASDRSLMQFYHRQTEKNSSNRHQHQQDQQHQESPTQDPYSSTACYFATSGEAAAGSDPANQQSKSPSSASASSSSSSSSSTSISTVRQIYSCDDYQQQQNLLSNQSHGQEPAAACQINQHHHQTATISASSVGQQQVVSSASPYTNNQNQYNYKVHENDWNDVVAENGHSRTFSVLDSTPSGSHQQNYSGHDNSSTMGQCLHKSTSGSHLHQDFNNNQKSSQNYHTGLINEQTFDPSMANQRKTTTTTTTTTNDYANNHHHEQLYSSSTYFTHSTNSYNISDDYHDNGHNNHINDDQYTRNPVNCDNLQDNLDQQSKQPLPPFETIRNESNPSQEQPAAGDTHANPMQLQYSSRPASYDNGYIRPDEHHMNTYQQQPSAVSLDPSEGTPFVHLTAQNHEHSHHHHHHQHHDHPTRWAEHHGPQQQQQQVFIDDGQHRVAQYLIEPPPQVSYYSLQQLTNDSDNVYSNQLSASNTITSNQADVTKASVYKGRRGRPRKKGPRSKNKANGKLWEFIRDLLLNERTNPSFIRWERREDGVFKFVQSDKVAKMWGERKQNPKMTYEKLSRAMRYYYKSKVLLPVFGRRLVYKFGPNATGWLPSPNDKVF